VIARRALTVSLALVLLLAGCGERGDRPADDAGVVLAEVGGRKITQADVSARIAALPPSVQSSLMDERGRFRVLKQLIEEELLYRGALADGADRDERFQQRLEATRRQLLIQLYLERKQEEASRVTEAEMLAFYEEHPEEYTIEKALRVRLLLTDDEAVAQRAREMVTEGLLPFEQACTRFSENPAVVEANGLIPEWVREGRAVPWIGNHPEFHRVAFSLKPGEVSEVFSTALGFMILRVEEVREETRRDFEEVQESIRARLAKGKKAAGLPELIEELERSHGVRMFEQPGRSAAELFAAARAAGRPGERIALYEEICERYPEHELAVEALFMVGFIRSEELGDTTRAQEAFRQVIERYPDSELAESARWMLTSQGEDAPAFEDGAAHGGAEEGSP
jgi:EpsD family peptidyl-prolyl cis-trans isomerase